MGLFSKKPKEPDYDKGDCEIKKKRIREILNETVENGNEYEVLYAYMNSSKFEQGLIFDTNTTTFCYYVVGYRKSDFDVILIQVDSELKEHTAAFHIEMDNVVNVSYDPKITKACLQYKKGYESYGELLDIGDTSRKTLYGPKNINQPEEREKFLDFLEEFRSILEEKGYKLDKWKR